MKSFIILSVCIAYCAAQSGPYSFGYQTSDGQSRQESGNGGAVSGAYSYIDANGDTRQVRYTADANGYRPEGDISVDQRTAAAAAQLEAQAPRAPAAPNAWAQPQWNAAPAPAIQWNSAPTHWRANNWNAAPISAPLTHAWASNSINGGQASYRVQIQH